MSTSRPDRPELLDRLQAWIAELRARGLRTDADLAHLRGVLAQSRGERLDLPNHALLVAMLCGPTAVGKSTLINTLAGREISLPGLGATTSAAVIYVHEDDDPERLFEYGKEVGQLARQAVVRHRRDALLHKVLIDTPDIDSVMTKHRALTGALVHAADLVLFVTTPERYKDMQAAQWVSEQSAQRAMAFILNKWDRESIGMQWDRRHLVEEDFRRVLRAGGFEASLIFKISCLAGGDGAPGADENQLPELRDWLERRLDSSAAAAIQDRRRVMAWGRLAAAIALNVPEPVDPGLPVAAAHETLADLRQQARPLITAAVAEVAADTGDRSLWPAMPGLFGAYARLLNWCTAKVTPARAWNNPSGLHLPGIVPGVSAAAETGTGPAEPVLWAPAFGRPLSQLFAETARRLRYELGRMLPLKVVEAQWEEAVTQLPARLAVLPSATWSDLTAAATKGSLRRWAGTGVLFGVELAIMATLATALWRIGYGFVYQQYESSALLYNTAALVLVLILCGHVLANLMFPSLRRLLLAELALRMQAIIDQTCSRMETALREHVAAIDRLVQEGKETQSAIDKIVQPLRHSGGTGAVDDLFSRPQGDTPPSGAADTVPALAETTMRRRAKFE